VNDYRDMLSHSFQTRRENNPNYSLRAFARDLLISPSRLSEVMAGKGNLSRRKADAIAKKLKFTPAKKQYFFDLIDSVASESDKVRSKAIERLESVAKDKVERYLPNRTFESIATWQHIAVWSFLFLPVFDGDCYTISRSLKIDIFDVYNILQRLKVAGLIKHQNGQWVPLVKEFSSGDDVPSATIRAYHDSVSALGRKSIEQQTVNERHLETLILPFNSTRINEVGSRIGSFVQSLAKEFGEDTEGDSVYAMSLQFFRVGDKPSSKSKS
jgi:uncharacterized protein (TIGR02147 family)